DIKAIQNDSQPIIVRLDVSHENPVLRTTILAISIVAVFNPAQTRNHKIFDNSFQRQHHNGARSDTAHTYVHNSQADRFTVREQFDGNFELHIKSAYYRQIESAVH